MNTSGRAAKLVLWLIGLAAIAVPPSALSLVTKSGKERRLDEMPIEDQMRVARAWEALKETRALSNATKPEQGR